MNQRKISKYSSNTNIYKENNQTSDLSLLIKYAMYNVIMTANCERFTINHDYIMLQNNALSSNFDNIVNAHENDAMVKIGASKSCYHE